MKSIEYIKKIFPYTSPVLAGYVFLGIAFGMLMRSAGFAFIYPVLMSVFIYSGALEYAAIPLLAAEFAPLNALFMGIMISIRHLFYGIPMLKKYSGIGKIKPFLIFGLTDETFSILAVTDTPEGIPDRSFYTIVTALNYFYWNLGTAIGSAIGGIADFSSYGLDFSLTALFIVLFLEQLKDRTGRISGFAGIVVSILVLIFAGSGSFVLFAMLGILVVLLGGRKVLDRE